MQIIFKLDTCEASQQVVQSVLEFQMLFVRSINTRTASGGGIQCRSRQPPFAPSGIIVVLFSLPSLPTVSPKELIFQATIEFYRMFAVRTDTALTCFSGTVCSVSIK